TSSSCNYSAFCTHNNSFLSIN
ncbi:hypothetical protein CP01DC11_1185B, partial [Chlamydia psittaci 01DC11]